MGRPGSSAKAGLPKNDLRLEVLGAIDEVMAALGLARATSQIGEANGWLIQIQRDLYGVMGEVAATSNNAARFRRIDESRVAWLETLVETINQRVQMPDEFILPGDTLPGAALDLGRTITRRAERRLVELVQKGGVDNPYLLQYMNRLSSFCFVLELLEIQAGWQVETHPRKDRSGFVNRAKCAPSGRAIEYGGNSPVEIVQKAVRHWLPLRYRSGVSIKLYNEYTDTMPG